MKLRIGMTLLISLALALGLAGVVKAQSCDTMYFLAGTGQPGGIDTVCGSSSVPNDYVSVAFDGTEVGTTVAEADGSFCVTFMIPADAALGTHSVTVTLSQAEEVCPLNYVVEAAAQPAAQTPVQTQAYTAVSSLPSTGLIAMLPAAGLAAAGAGWLLARRRR